MSNPPAAPTESTAPEPAVTADEPRRPPNVRGIAVLLLWAAAAVLALVSALSGLYSVTVRGTGVSASFSVDMAGHSSGKGAVLLAGRPVGYNVLLLVCALAFGLLVVGAVGRLLHLPSGPRTDLAITGGAFAVTGLLAGVLATMYQQSSSTLDYFRSRVEGGLSLAAGFDAGPYLGLGALVCAVLAIAVTHSRRHRSDAGTDTDTGTDTGTGTDI